jgi:hypothetical protein
VTAILLKSGKVTGYSVEQKVAISSLVPGSWPAKSLAGKPRTAKPLALELLVEGFERGVLRREAALAGDVDDEQDFAGVVGEGGGGAGDGSEGDIGEGGHGGSLQGYRQRRRTARG